MTIDLILIEYKNDLTLTQALQQSFTLFLFSNYAGYTHKPLNSEQAKSIEIENVCEVGEQMNKSLEVHFRKGGAEEIINNE